MLGFSGCWCRRTRAAWGSPSSTPSWCSKSSDVRRLRGRLPRRRSSARRCSTAPGVADGLRWRAVAAEGDYVPDADVADVLIVVDGEAARLVEGAGELTRQPTVDPSRPLFSLPDAGGGAARCGAALPACATVPCSRTAAQLVGASQHMLEASRRVREDPQAVRPRDRLVPGAQASAGRPDAGRRVRPSAGPSRGLLARRRHVHRLA